MELSNLVTLWIYPLLEKVELLRVPSKRLDSLVDNLTPWSDIYCHLALYTIYN